MSEINENDPIGEVTNENENETETGYVRVKRVYATTEDEVTLIVEPIDGAIPENGVKMQDGTYRVVWSMKHVKDLIREYAVASVMQLFIEEGEPLPLSMTSFGTYCSANYLLLSISHLINGIPEPTPTDGDIGIMPDVPGGSEIGNNG